MKNKKMTTFPRAGSESSKVVTKILICFIELMDLNGLIILTTLMAENRAEMKNEIIPVTTTIKSRKFHPSLKYVFGPNMNPIAIIFSMNSIIKIDVKRYSALSIQVEGGSVLFSLKL